MTRHVGLLLPSSNTVMAGDLARELRGRAQVHSARMYLEDPVTPEAELRMIDEFAEPAARDIGTLRPDVVVFGCTSAGALRGAAADAALRARLTEIAGAPVLGVLDAMTSALRRRGARRVSLLTPYVDALNDPIVSGLRADGFVVDRIVGLGKATNIEIGRVPPLEIVAAAREAAAPESDALAVACTNFRALEVRDEIAAEIGIEVVTACSATAELVQEFLDEPA